MGAGQKRSRQSGPDLAPAASLIQLSMRDIEMLHNVGLRIFVRGGCSFGNRIEGNTLTSSANGALSICYNPTDTDPAGPQGDLVSKRQCYSWLANRYRFEQAFQ